MMRKTTLLTAFSGCALVHAVAADTLPQVQFNHKDWEMACDNTRTCRAAGYQSEAIGPSASVLLTRRAGPGQPVEAEVQLAQTGDEHATPPSLRMTIGKQDLGHIQLDRGTRTGKLSSRQTAALLGALPKSDSIAWVAGKARWSISTMGANAVLLKMDAFQGRIGTPGALVRKGDQPESSVLPALPRPVVHSPRIQPGQAATVLSPTQTRALLAELRKLDKEGDCMGLTPETEQAPQLDLQTLSADAMLVSTACWRGAYNTGTGYWVSRRTAPFSPRFITADADHEEDGVIQAFHKGRGIADCVAIETWTWDGNAFVHTSATTTGMCRAFAVGGAWDFPTLVTEVRRTP